MQDFEAYATDGGLLSGTEAATSVGAAAALPLPPVALSPPVESIQIGGWLPSSAGSMQRLMQVPLPRGLQQSQPQS